MKNWIVESGQMKVKVTAETSNIAMCKAVFNFNGMVGKIITAREENLPESETLYWLTEKIIEQIEATVDERMNRGIDFIKNLREQLGIDKASFARKCHLHPQHYYRIENKKQDLSGEVLEKILFHNGISKEQFFNKLYR